MKEEKWKLVIILELSVLFFLISFFLIFLSVRIYVGSLFEAQQIILSQEKGEFEKTEISDLKKELSEINSQMEKLDSFYSGRISFSDFLGEIKGFFPKEITIKQISINIIDAGQKTINVSVSGNAPRVEDLILLRENLKKDGRFIQINFSPSSIWVESLDIDFNINFQASLKK